MGRPNNRFIIIERREKVLIMLSQGLNEIEISRSLCVGQSTVCRDIKAIKKQSQSILEKVIEDLLPYEFGRCLVSIDQVAKESWRIYQDNSGTWTNKDKINALKLIKEAIRTKLEILLQGPTSLHLQGLRDKVDELNKSLDENVPGLKDLLMEKGTC